MILAVTNPRALSNDEQRMPVWPGLSRHFLCVLAYLAATYAAILFDTRIPPNRSLFFATFPSLPLVLIFGGLAAGCISCLVVLFGAFAIMWRMLARSTYLALACAVLTGIANGIAIIYCRPRVGTVTRLLQNHGLNGSNGIGGW